MNDKFKEPARISARRVTHTFMCLAIAGHLAAPAFATGLRIGPVVDVSDPDALSACGSNGAEKETTIAVNPTNPRNIAVSWWGGLAKGTVVAVTFDGGRTWQQVVVPGITTCTGGTIGYDLAVDEWLSFAPNGDLYHSCLPGNSASGLNALMVSKSLDGGLHWTNQFLLAAPTDPRFDLDKPSITADPTDSRYVYTAWEQLANGNRRFISLARTTNGGRSWEPPRVIVDLGNSDQAEDPQILVMPDGTLVCVFLEALFSNSNGGAQKQAIVASVRSTDKGLTWSAPIQGPRVPVFQATDPDTGIPYVNQNSYPPALGPVAADPNTGTLYVAFEDTEFNGHYADIAFTMSTDRGATWSVPIPVNQAPANIDPANRQAFIPTVAVAADGTIGVTYYDFRFNDASPGLLTDYWLVLCHPSASTPPTNPSSWGNEVRLTDTSFDLEKAAHPEGAWFVGDYEALTTVGSDFIAAWSQPHDNDLDSVFVRRVGP
jgi:hypothetical protein